MLHNSPASPKECSGTLLGGEIDTGESGIGERAERGRRLFGDGVLATSCLVSAREDDGEIKPVELMKEEGAGLLNVPTRK
jgi:hypothetical protein